MLKIFYKISYTSGPNAITVDLDHHLDVDSSSYS